MYESTNSGFSGFFYAANDLNIVLLVLLIFSLDWVFINSGNKEPYTYYMVCSFLLIISLILLGSKSSAALGGLVVLVYLFRFFVKGSLITKLKGAFVFLLGFGITFFIIQNYYYDEILNALSRHTYFFQKDYINQGSFISFILSNRNGFLEASITAFLSSGDELFRMFFGAGRYQHMAETGAVLNAEPKGIEMDMFDVFFSYGLIGVLLVYTYFTSFIIGSVQKEIIKSNFRYVFGFIIVAVYSFLGGHVLFSAMSGSFLALICCGLYVIKMDKVSQELTT